MCYTKFSGERMTENFKLLILVYIAIQKLYFIEGNKKYMITRKKTREVKVGSVIIGGENPISVQSMLNVKHDNFAEMKTQIALLKHAGCDIIRMAILNHDTIKTIGKLKELMAVDKAYDIPIVADIHFNHKLAVECAYAGIDKIRINPGNIGDENNIKLVADICGNKKIPIRIGVNGGSVEEHILKKYGSPSVDALVESAAYNIRLLEKFDFNDIVVSIKSSDISKTIEANLNIADMFDYPLHIGITEAGTAHIGLIKNSIGIGSLLNMGIGDTIRVSLTATPVLEVYEGISILKALGLYKKSIDIISCPTCGRCKTDIIGISNEVEKRLSILEKRMDGEKKRNIKVAVMGCAVNGPGEAREADVGIAGGNREFLLFRNGEAVTKIPASKAVDILIKEVEDLIF